MGGKLPPYAVSESDNNPIVYQPWKIIFPNGTLTDVGDGTVYVGIGTSISETTSITISTYDVRTPLLSAGTVLYMDTNGNTATFLNGAGVFTTPSGSPVVYAPSGATYIVQTNDSVLPSAQILASLSTGLLKNTAVTGVLSAASGGVDFENILTVSSPLVKTFSTISIDTASAVSPGFLRTADFNLFNAKASTATTINVTGPISGGGTLAANRTIWILSSAASTDGYLRGADFNTFNAKASTATTITCTAPMSGGGTLAANRTIWVLSSTATSDGYLKSTDFANFNLKVGTSTTITCTAPMSGGGTLASNRTIWMLSSTATSDGYLKSSDFNNFNAKASTATTITVLSPLSGGGSLAANRIIGFTTDGTATNFLNGLGLYSVPSGVGGIAYAPSGATYIVQTNDAILANEQVLAALSTGLLKNTAVTGVLTVASGGVDFENILVAASPLLKSISTISIVTDGTTTNYFRGDGTYAIPSSDSGVKMAIFTIYSSATWTADTVPIFQAPYNTPITLKQINVTASGSSPKLGFNIQVRPWTKLANTGSNILSALQSAPTAGIEITSAISTTTIQAKAHLMFASSAIIIGQADYVTGVIYYSRNSA